MSDANINFPDFLLLILSLFSSDLNNGLIESTDSNVLSAGGAFVETLWMRELTVDFIRGPLSTWNTFLVEASGALSVDCRDATAVTLHESLIELTFDH